MGLEVEGGVAGGSRDRGERIFGIIMNSSLLLGIAAGFVLGNLGFTAWAGAWAWAGLSGSLAGAGWDRRGRWRIGTVVRSIAASVTVIRTVVGRRGSELRNGRTRELVGRVVEGVDEDTGVVVLVSTR